MTARDKADPALVATLGRALADYSLDTRDGVPLRLGLLFGSRSNGRARVDSDVDVALIAVRRLESADVLALTRQLTERLALPVQIVDLYDLPHPVIAEALDGVRVHGDHTAFADLAARNVTMYEDFGRLRERLLAERRREWLGP